MSLEFPLRMRCNECQAEFALTADQRNGVLKCPQCGHTLKKPMNSESSDCGSQFEDLDLDQLWQQETVVPNDVESSQTVKDASLPDASLPIEPQLAETTIQADRLDDLSHVEQVAEETEVEVIATDEVPLKIEGLSALMDVIPVKCRVCDSQVLAKESEIGQNVECPICFSSIPVSAAKADSIPRRKKYSAGTVEMKLDASQASNQSGSNSLDSSDDETELRLSSEEMPTPAHDRSVDRTVNLANSEDATPPSNMDAQGQPKRVLSRREKYERALERAREKEQKSRPSLFSRELAKPRKKSKPIGETVTSDTAKQSADQLESIHQEESKMGDVGDRLPSPPDLDNPAKRANKRKNQPAPIEFSILKGLSLAIKLCNQPSFMWRAAISVGLISAGNWLMHSYNLSDPETPPLEWLKNSALWSIAGIPYLVGIFWLWTLAGIIFRELAKGGDQVTDWGFRSLTDFFSTFTLFSFSFVVAGLPIAPMALFNPLVYMLIAPLRFFLSPLFLLAAWYNQHPLAIVAVDAFAQTQQLWRGWVELYGMLFGLSVIAFVGASLLIASISWFYFLPTLVLSIPGSTLIVLATLVFAAVTGCHVGNVTREIQK